MLCTIYKSSLKTDTYLYIAKRDDFSVIAPKLLTTFGKPIMVMILNLAGQQKLALADKQKVITEIQQHGFYLQLPPPTENLLKEHLKTHQPIVRNKSAQASKGVEETAINGEEK